MKTFNLLSTTKAFVAVFTFITASLHAAPPSVKTSTLNDKATNEMPQPLLEKRGSEIGDAELSTEGCRCVAAIATSVLEAIASAEKENQALEQAFLDVDLESICTPEVFLNPSKISEKKDQLKKLLTFLDESESRLGNMISDLKWQALSKADVDEDFRKGFAEGCDQNLEDNKRLLQEKYNLKRDIVWTYIKFLDFVSDKASTVKNDHLDLKNLLKSKEDFHEMQVYLDAIINAQQADEEMTLASEQRKQKVMNELFLLTRPKESIALIRMAEMYKEKIAPYNQACAEIDWHNIYTEAVVLNRETITEKKKALERIYPILDEMEKRWETEIPDAMRKVTLPSCQNNQEREILEKFITTVLPLEKELVGIRKKYTLEYLQLLNFLSARYGKYKVVQNKIRFASEIENKICESHLKKIWQLLQKEESTGLQVSQLTQEFSNRLKHVRNPSPSEQK